jgi:hypothetical protein
LATLIQIRRDTEANWTSNNPVLASGEIAFSTDQNKIKIGNGSSAWTVLDYLNVTTSEIESLISSAISNSTTDEISEGTNNLYFTEQRAVDAVAGGDFNTDVVEEGTTNLYYTDARVENVIAASDTDDITEGTINLYFTESRARSSISGSTGITYSSTDGVIFVDTDEIATVEYVNATAEGLHVHTSVATATTADIADLSSPPATIDGVTLTEGMRVLVKDQSDSSENGIYVLDTGALVRADDYDTAGDILSGDFVFVTNGSTQEATGWVQTETVTTLGSDAIIWTQFIGAGVFTAGEGLDLTGNVFSLDATTDLVAEGTTNLYYTEARVEDVIANSTTDDISEGTTNLYFTDLRVQDATPGRITSSSTQPESPSAGDGWLDISTGKLYVYITDEDSSQWIEV